MLDWTRKNFDDLRDVSPQGVRIQWRFARDALGSPQLGVSRFTYDRGARTPCGHRHRVQEEAYVVVAGSGRAKFDDEAVNSQSETCCGSLPRWSARSRPARRAST
jgi:mannose-6-phosphate isomerase-like protein (cupin superfamily)